MSLDVPSYILALLTAGGGIAGYARAGSVPSLVAGCGVGLLYGFGGYQIQNGKPYGVEASLLASIVLGGSSIPKAFRTQKPVPIMLSLIAAYGIYTFGGALYRRNA